MKKEPSIINPLSMLRRMATHRKAWLRMNRIDYSNGLCSEKLYRFSNVIVNLTCIFYFNLLFFVILLILGPIYFW